MHAWLLQFRDGPDRDAYMAAPPSSNDLFLSLFLSLSLGEAPSQLLLVKEMRGKGKSQPWINNQGRGNPSPDLVGQGYDKSSTECVRLLRQQPEMRAVS